MIRSNIILLSGLIYLCACTGKVTLPDIDISVTDDGVVALPENVPDVFKQYFVKYTKVIAPNGKPIHILAQDGWTNDQIKHGRNVLEHILTNYEGSVYGNDKSLVANSMSDQKATMVFFNTEPDLEKAFDEGLGFATDLSMQDLRANECTAVGSEDYMNHITRDASYEEIWHLVHDYGIKPTLPKMIKEMRVANDVAEKNGWKGWPEDEPQEHPNEYMGVLIDNYYDLWKIMPKLYEGREIAEMGRRKDRSDHGQSFEGKSHFGRYFANSRFSMKEKDPLGHNVIENYFHPYLTFTPELPENFKGVFSMEFDKNVSYTYKSQHLLGVTIKGDNNVALIGNYYDNKMNGNQGDNSFQGNGGNDIIDGAKGVDTAVYRGPAADYKINILEDRIEVVDNNPDRDGKDTLINVESGKFVDRIVSFSNNNIH